MAYTASEQQKILDKQTREWEAEMKRIADLYAAAKGGNCALVLVTGTGQEYLGAAPERILEDATRPSGQHLAAGLEIQLLNPSA